MLQQHTEIKDAEIKGSLFPLSILQLEETDLGVLSEQLERKLAQSKDFFYRAPLVINIEKTQGAVFDFAQLKQVIESYDFICVGVSNATAEQADAAKTAGFAILKQPRASATKATTEHSTDQKTQAPKTAAPSAVPLKLEELAPQKAVAKVIHQNVRSGQQIYAKDSDLIIIGSVGNGAEVIADGNIHIYGQLRGRALAGAAGAAQSIIYCQSMEAELVSIAGNYWLSDQLPQNIWRESALIKFHSEKLSAQSIGPNGPKH